MAKASRAGGAGMPHADVFGSGDCESKVDSTFEYSNYARHCTETEIHTAKFFGLPSGRERRRLAREHFVPRDSLPQTPPSRGRSGSYAADTRGIGQTGKGAFC